MAEIWLWLFDPVFPGRVAVLFWSMGFLTAMVIFARRRLPHSRLLIANTASGCFTMITSVPAQKSRDG